MLGLWNKLLKRLVKSPPPLPTAASGGATFLDAYRRHRCPTDADLLQELKSTAWTCASINAAVCAAYPPRLYRAVGEEGRRHRLDAVPIVGPEERCLRKRLSFRNRWKHARRFEEVLAHPLLDLLERVNNVHSAFDLWELTQLYLELIGAAYWYLDRDAPDAPPSEIWILPAQAVIPRRNPESRGLIDYYEYRTGGKSWRFDPADILAFRLPDPRDPYTGGLSPLRACFEQVALTSEYAAMKRAVYDNVGLPRVVVSPEEVLSPEERDRLEEQWERKFVRGGAGKALISDARLRVDVLSASMGDLAALADMKATKEDICNAFHVPLPFFSSDTNLANMQAADHLHKTLAIRPRLRRRDEKLNEFLVPLFDESGELFFLSDDPTPAQQSLRLRQETLDLKFGVRTINEIRAERGLAPVPWGDEPSVHQRR